MILLNILLATILVSLVSLVGVIFLTWKKTKLHNFLILFVAMAAGTMMGSVFLHLLPEALTQIAAPRVLRLTLISFVGFVVIEKILHWRHCHEEDCREHQFGYMSLVGDGVHNFIDGLIIAGAFLASPALGVSTTLAIAMHEIPQEIGDLGVLLHAGFSQKKALLFNLLSAVLAVAGGVVGYLILHKAQTLAMYLLPVAAGGFLYISASDLIPELRGETNKKLAVLSFIMFLLGIGVLLIFKD